jgi:4-amino-4-deoxy-L-arabinose transferase-like glycosyltransferase
MLPPDQRSEATSATSAAAMSRRLVGVAGNVLPIVVGLLGVFAILARTPFGARITPDPVSYLATARNLLRGRGFVSFNGAPYTDWPPLFPAAIAAMTVLVGRVHRAVTLLNALAFGAAAAAAGVWTRRRTGSAVEGAAVAIAAVRAMPLVYVAVYAWSEPLYVLLTLLALFALAAYDRSGRRRTLVLAATLASAAALTRYVGVAGIATGVLVTLVRRGARWRRRVGDALLFGVLATLPNALWSLRNYFASGHLTGDRRTAIGSLAHNVGLYLSIVGGWVIPPDAPEPARLMAGAAFLAFSLAIGVLVWRRSRSEGEMRPILPLAIYLIVYTALLLASATLTPIDPVGDRLMVPLVLPGIVALGCTLYPARRRIGRPRLRWTAQAGALAVFALWIAMATGPAAEAAEVQNAREEANLRDWRLSGVGRYLRHRHIPGTVFSNDPWTLFLMTGIRARMAPMIRRSHPALPAAPELQDYEDYLGDGPEWVVWLDRQPGGRDDLPRTLVALSQRLALIPVRQSGDGAVYFVTDQEDPAPRGSCPPGKPGTVICVVPIRRPPPRSAGSGR